MSQCSARNWLAVRLKLSALTIGNLFDRVANVRRDDTSWLLASTTAAICLSGGWVRSPEQVELHWVDASVRNYLENGAASLLLLLQHARNIRPRRERETSSLIACPRCYNSRSAFERICMCRSYSSANAASSRRSSSLNPSRCRLN
jgi:hypothetical protein